MIIADLQVRGCGSHALHGCRPGCRYAGYHSARNGRRSLGSDDAPAKLLEVLVIVFRTRLDGVSQPSNFCKSSEIDAAQLNQMTQGNHCRSPGKGVLSALPSLVSWSALHFLDLTAW